MKLRIDRAGRIVLPKPLRDRFALSTDSELELVEQPEGILLRPIENGPSMVKVDGLWIHQGVTQPGADWEKVLGDVRDERIRSILGGKGI